jgi:Transglutaminase-like superfamily
MALVRDRLPLRRRLLVRLAVGVAQTLALLPPRRIRVLLTWLSRGARPATYLQAKAARDVVLAVSPSCAGWRGCLPRSLAVALLCRLSSAWPTWCVGVRVTPPFGAHAWVEADHQLVDEVGDTGSYRRLITVRPRQSSTLMPHGDPLDARPYNNTAE